MNVTERLDQLRTKMPECVAVAFADLSAQMVLSVSTRTRQPQEALDNLSVAAADLLNGPVAEPFTGTLAAENAGIGHAVTQTRSETRIYVRSATDPAEALCCICGPTVDISAVLRHARDAMLNISNKG